MPNKRIIIAGGTGFIGRAIARELASRGAETTASGEVIADFDPYDPREAMELFGQALGFTPTELSEGWEKKMAERDAVNYYRTLQATVLAQHNYAMMQEDREAITDMREAILEYNSQVPFPEMKLTPKLIRQSAKMFLENQIKAGMGEGADKKYRRLAKSIEEAYPDPVGDSARRDESGRP